MNETSSENQIREIQKRIETLRKEKYNETQREFAQRLGVTYDTYKNNVNSSKNPKNLKHSQFLKNISLQTGVSMSYLLGEVDYYYEKKEGIVELPIDFEIKSNQLQELYSYLESDSHYELSKALHFLFVKLPNIYSETYESAIIATYKLLSECSFFQNPELYNNTNYRTLINTINTKDIFTYKKMLLESIADEHFSHKRYSSALHKYIEALLFTDSDDKANQISDVVPLSIYFNIDKRIAEKIVNLTTKWTKWKEQKFSELELAVIADLQDKFSKK